MFFVLLFLVFVFSSCNNNVKHEHNASDIVRENEVVAPCEHAGSYDNVNCNYLETVLINNNLEEIGYRAFYDNNMYHAYTIEVYYLGTSEEWALVKQAKYESIAEFMYYGIKEDKVYYYSENEPVDYLKYWHYVNDKPTLWE